MLARWLAVGLAVVAVAVQPSRVAVAATPARSFVSTLGMHSLSSWNVDNLVFRLRNVDYARRSVPFWLPAGARQGPRKWYLIRLHFRITFEQEAGTGGALVSGLTNRRSAAQIKFDIPIRGKRALIHWNTLDYIRGYQGHRTRSRTIDVRFANYVQFAGVRPGRNSFAVQYESFGKLGVKSLVVLRDSGIEVTSLSPARLKIRVSNPPTRVRRGSDFAVAYTLTNTGSQVARNVEITARADDNIHSLKENTRRERYLRGSLSGTMHFRAVAPGSAAVLLLVKSGSNHPGVRIPIVVVDAASLSERAAAIATKTVGALLVLFGASLVLRRRSAR
jgi:hypothetical protein